MIKAKNNTHTYVSRLLSLEEEITFNQIYFMLLGDIPGECLYTTIKTLDSLKQDRVINEETYKMLINRIPMSSTKVSL